MSAPADFQTSTQAFFAGVRHTLTTVFFLVLMGTYIGIGALAHDYGFSIWWLTASTMFVWAAPAQVILVSSLGTGAAMIEIAIAVSLSAIRLFPMVVALLPVLRTEDRRIGKLLLPAHFTSISMWIESLRMLPDVPRERRIAYCNGISTGYMGSALTFGCVGYYLAAGLPTLFAATLLFLSPLSFLFTTLRNSRAMIEKLAFVLGLLIGPVLTYYHVGLDLLWTGVSAGLIAYGVHRLRGGMA